MAENSKIEWTHHTANLWHGCTKVHAGCDHCYAETLSIRWKRDIWGNDKPRMEIKSVWKDLKRYQDSAAAIGEVHRVFVGSMMDIFEKEMALIDSKGEPVCFDDDAGYPMNTGHLRTRLFLQIYEGRYPNLLFLFLTKRPSNINKMIPSGWLNDPPKNVMFGTSPCDQKTADTLIPQLLQVNGQRFLSIEPLLGPVELWNHDDGVLRGCGVIKSGGVNPGTSDFPAEGYDDSYPGIDWVIVGGESGHHARPMHPDWVRSIRDQCKSAGVPFFFKQYGEWAPVDDVDPSGDILMFKDGWDKERKTPLEHICINHDGQTSKRADDVIRPGEKNCILYRFGKKMAGRNIDEQIYDEFPVIN